MIKLSKFARFAAPVLASCGLMLAASSANAYTWADAAAIDAAYWAKNAECTRLWEYRNIADADWATYGDIAPYDAAYNQCMVELNDIYEQYIIVVVDINLHGES